MKKTTYLVREHGTEGEGLRVASQEEWDTILKKNRTLPCQDRRFFILDSFEDCGDIDCMYIETSKEEYDKWHSEHQVKYQKRKDCGPIERLSLDTSSRTEDESTLRETIADEYNLEELVIEQIQLGAMKKALSEWRPWAVELLEIYLNGQKLSASRIFSQKYKLTDRTIQRRKKAMEKFIQEFLK